MLGRSALKKEMYEGNLSAKANNKGVGMNPSGTKYAHAGMRKGLASAMDSGIIQQRQEQEARNYGMLKNDGTVDKNAIGGYSFQLMSGGAAQTDKPLNIGGRLFYPNANGQFRIVDQDWLDKTVSQERERFEYIKPIVESCSISNDVASGVLGLDAATLISLCEPGGIAKNMPDAMTEMGVSGQLDKADCSPSFLATLSKDSPLYSEGIAKLTRLCLAFMPIIEHDTPNSVENAGKAGQHV
jgi:hypothetical protein